MDTRSTTQKSVRLLDDSGQGAALVILREAGISALAPLLATEFRVLSVAGGTAVDELADTLAKAGITEATLVADSATSIAALELALAHPGLVSAVALLAPPAVRSDLAGRMADGKTQVLALFGTRDAARPPDAARAFCKAIPNCRLVYVFDAARAPDDERPEAVAAAIREFAAKRQGFLVTGKSGKLYP
jgi:pimeloyl-ACP methyl ester carboxylesterase